MTEYLGGVIVVERRSHDWMAYIAGNRAYWDCSPRSADEAVGSLLGTHPNKVVAAIKSR